ncbi:hypothetical protein T310_6871, partial [Rasamsonia emersonii CBS 393.64]
WSYDRSIGQSIDQPMQPASQTFQLADRQTGRQQTKNVLQKVTHTCTSTQLNSNSQKTPCCEQRQTKQNKSPNFQHKNRLESTRLTRQDKGKCTANAGIGVKGNTRDSRPAIKMHVYTVHDRKKRVSNTKVYL